MLCVNGAWSVTDKWFSIVHAPLPTRDNGFFGTTSVCSVMLPSVFENTGSQKPLIGLSASRLRAFCFETQIWDFGKCSVSCTGYRLMSWIVDPSNRSLYCGIDRLEACSLESPN